MTEYFDCGYHRQPELVSGSHKLLAKQDAILKQARIDGL